MRWCVSCHVGVGCEVEVDVAFTCRVGRLCGLVGPPKWKSSGLI